MRLSAVRIDGVIAAHIGGDRGVGGWRGEGNAEGRFAAAHAVEVLVQQQIVEAIVAVGIRHGGDDGRAAARPVDGQLNGDAGDARFAASAGCRG